MDILYRCDMFIWFEGWVYYRYDTLDGCCRLDGAP
jgi:hypothetical protein